MAPDDWTYLLGAAFLEAAVSCGWSCARRYVADGRLVEAPPPGCPCQLVAVVAEGWQRRDATNPCSLAPVVDVRLVLDLCVPVPASDAAPDPVEEATSARSNATVRWQIQKGLRGAAQRGDFHGLTWDPDDPMPPGARGCSNVTPGLWAPTMREGGMARWETTWRFTE